MRRFLSVVLLFATAALAAPASAQASKQHGDRNRITKDDLAEMPMAANTAYDLVRTMRPQWLNPPFGKVASSNLLGDGGGAKEIILYVDDKRQPSIDDLKVIKASTVVEMKYLDQNRAIQMRGPGHELGVIEITTIEKKEKP